MTPYISASDRRWAHGALLKLAPIVVGRSDLRPTFDRLLSLFPPPEDPASTRQERTRYSVRFPDYREVILTGTAVVARELNMAPATVRTYISLRGGAFTALYDNDLVTVSRLPERATTTEGLDLARGCLRRLRDAA